MPWRLRCACGLASAVARTCTCADHHTTGAAVKGPVANATVTIKNASTGATLATGATSPDGSYSISVPTASGDVIIEITGGSYVDEPQASPPP